eukprot:XP_013998201.1 PREDICTED: uncharacterized protein LOC106570419 isoform X2 [Salmo salar]
MLTRNFLILCSLAVLLVQADFDTNNNHAAQAMSTDKDSTSEEAPTESINAISSDQPNDKPQYYNEGLLLLNLMASLDLVLQQTVLRTRRRMKAQMKV